MRKYIMKLVSTIVAIAVTTSLCAHAQTSSDRIERISIIGSKRPIEQHRLASSVTVISQDVITQSGAFSVVDLLRGEAGMNISQSGPTGTLTEIRMRGSESNHVVVLVDGIEINDVAQGSNVDLSHVAIGNIERIEILRGPQSALWGSGAIAGVISITTKQSSDAFSANVDLSIGSLNTKKLYAGVSGTNNNLSYSLSFNRFSTQGDNIARQGDEKDGYENSSFNGKVQYQLSDAHNILLNTRYVDFTSEFDAIDFASTGLPVDANNETHGLQKFVSARWNFTPKNSIWSQYLAYEWSQLSNTNFGNNINTGQTIGKKQRTSWVNTFALQKDSFVNIGMESVIETFTQFGEINFGDPNQRQQNDTWSVLADSSYELLTPLFFSASIRYDNNSEFDNDVSHKIGLTYLPNSNIRMFASQGIAVKNPTFTERFGFFPQSFLGNPNLIPESSNSIELGAEYTFANSSVNITWFDATLDNEIDGFVFDSTTNLFTAANRELESKREGIEVSASTVIDNLSLSMNYTYLDASENRVRETRRANHVGNLSLSYQLPHRQHVYLKADYVGSHLDRFFPPFPTPSRIEKLDSYWLVSANYSFSFDEQLKLEVRADNLLDEEVEDVIGFRQQGRRLMLSVKYSWY